MATRADRGWARRRHWTRAWAVTLLVVGASLAVRGHGDGGSDVRGPDVQTYSTGPGTPPPTPSPPLLLWLPVHVSEPDENLDTALACLFRRWTPSLAGTRFDVLVTVAGDGRTATGLPTRASAAAAAITASTGHIRPRPRVMAHPIGLEADTYDMDEARGRKSSYAGPNAVFNHVMTGLMDGSLRPQSSTIGAVGTGKSGGGDGTTSQAIAISTAMPSYAYVQLIETDCCAASHGWLDALLQPMLQDPHTLISGSRGRGACWTGEEYGGCKLTVDPATPHAHLRDHINGNALYRVGPDLGALIEAARAKYLDTVPFDVALHLVGGGDRAHDNTRSYSAMALPVDGARFADPAYYGDDHIAFVHAPRRLRASGLEAVKRRLDVGKPVTVVVVPPMVSMVGEALLSHVHAGLARVSETRNALFLALDEAGHAAASRVAPLRVVRAGGDDDDGGRMEGKSTEPRVEVEQSPPGPGAEVEQSPPGPGAEVGQPTLAPGAADEEPTIKARTLRALLDLARAGLTTFAIGVDAVILRPYTPHLSTLAEEQPHTVWTLATSPIPATQGLLPLLVPAAAAPALEGWVEAGGPAFSTAHPIPTTIYAISHLPPDLFPPASSVTGPLWTEVARSNTALVVAWDGAWPATPAALASLGLWSAPRTGLAWTCANHSALATGPLSLTSFASIRRALALHAAFADFARAQAIECVVLPGFRLGTTGSVLPARAVLRPDSNTFDGTAAVFSSQAALESATGGRVGQYVKYGGTMAVPRKSDPSTFIASPSSLFTPPLAVAVDTALAGLPPTYHCVVDERRSVHDVRLLSLSPGGLNAVAAAVRKLVVNVDAPVLLTGAWRSVGAWPHGAPPVVTLADVAGPVPPHVDAMASLVRHGSAPSASLASSPWAGVIEYVACQRATAVHKLDGAGMPPATLDHLAAHIHPAILAEDLTRLARWLERPDRPSNLATAKRASLVLPVDAPPVAAPDFYTAVLAPTLGMARAGGARIVALPRPPGSARPWSAVIGEAALAAAHADHAGLVPASVGWLLDGPVAATANNNTHHWHPASVDVWRASEHSTAVRALEEAWRAMGGKEGHAMTVHLPARATQAQYTRLKHFADGARAEVFSL